MDNKVSLDRLISYIIEISKEDNNYTESESEEKESTNTSNKENLCPGEMSNLEVLPDKLKSFIGQYTEDYYRYGVVKEKKDKKNCKYNISLYYSIVLCIDKQFVDLTENERYVYLERLVGMMKLNFDETYKEYKYIKLGWTKKKLLQEINAYTNSHIIIKFLSDYLNVNIFIFDWNTEEVSVCYPEEYFNIYKPSIFLLLKDNFYEPIISSCSKLLTYDDLLLQFILNNNKKRLSTLNVYMKNKQNDKIFDVKLEDLESYLQNEKDIEDSKEEGNDIDSNNDDKKQLQLNEQDIQNDFEDASSESSESAELSDDSTDRDDETELEIAEQNIFYKKKNKEESPKQIKVNLNTEVNDKMTLKQLQKIATSLKISTFDGKYKNGSVKQRTKEELCTEINKLVV